MEYMILPDDMLDALALADILKSEESSRQLKFAMLWYARGQADALTLDSNLQPTG